MPFTPGPNFGRKPAPSPRAEPRKHVVTVEFTIWVEEDETCEHEQADLCRAIGILYGDYQEHGDGPGPHPDPTFYTPQGEWRVVSSREVD